MDTIISPIDGLKINEFEQIRDQIIEYMKMYDMGGEPIGAYKIMKLFEPHLRHEEKFLIMKNNMESDRRIIAYAAWRAAADALRMYPDNKHTFSDYWETVK